jgi:multicomponent Na+:H+ antiporter subunit G
MSNIAQGLAILFIIGGTFFSVVGVVGLVRFPDIFTRLHATGKVGIFGVVLLLIAVAISTPLGWGKALILILLLVISGPVTASALASAAYRIGIRPVSAIQDDLQQTIKKP